MQASTVVGYQAVANEEGGTFKTSVATFLPMTGTGKLSDLVPSSAGTTALTYNNFEIQLLNPDGETATVNEETMGAFCPDAVADYEDCDLAFTYVPADGKWYLTADKKPNQRNYEMNDYPIPVGTGFLLYPYGALATGMKMTYSGQVMTAPLDVTQEEGGSFKLTGNIAPCDKVLKDFLPKSAGTTALTYNNFEIQLLNPDGETATVNEETMGAFCPDAVADYEDCDLAFTYVPADGEWYLTADKKPNQRNYLMNSYPIPAASGLLLYPYGALATGMTLELPPAIPSANKDEN